MEEEDEVLAEGVLEEGEIAEEALDRRRVEYLRPGGRIGGNIQSWLLTIGTHKKPLDEREWHLLRDSLVDAIHRIVSNPLFKNQIVYRFEAGRGRSAAGNQPFFAEQFRTDDNLQITAEDIKYVVERGSKQGRIDAHILYTVEFNDHYLQIDHIRLQELVDDELATENLKFQSLGVKSSKIPTALAWCEPKVYTSFRSLGRTMRQGAEYYIRKNLESTNPSKKKLYLSEADALRTFAVGGEVIPHHGARDILALV